MSETVGIVGIGLLGSAIAARLAETRYLVHGYDPAAPQDSPARLCSSEAEVFAQCDRVILSLPDSTVAANVIAAVGEQLRAGQVVIDTTTGAPKEMLAIAQDLASHGAHYVEATVAGSSEQLRRGEAALFVAGDEAVIDEIDPILAGLAEKRHYLGPVGKASKFKLVHNLILGLHRAVLAEGLQFASALGFDPSETLDLLQQTPAVSGVMATKGQRIAERDYDAPQALLSQHLKDVRLILAEAEKHGAVVPLSELHRQLLERVEGRGFGGADNSAITEAFNPE